MDAESQNIPNTGTRYLILIMLQNENIKVIMPSAIEPYIRNTPAPAYLSFLLYINAKTKIKNINAIILKTTISNLKFSLLIAKLVM